MSQNFFLTGCASGMGKHLTNVLQQRGDCVFATDISHDVLKENASELGWPEDRVKLRQLDVTDPEAWEATFAEAVEAFGGIDVTMNIAGLLMSSWVTESPLKETNAQIDVNIKGVAYGTQVSARHMVERGHGHIINIASVAGLVPVPGLSIYAATKHAVRAFSISAALELRPKGVYVTAVCPASVQTPMLDNQEGVDAAEMFFSGAKILTLEDIERAILNRAMKRKPLEVHVPVLKVKYARWFGVFPWLAPIILPMYRNSGRRRMAERRAGRAGS